MSDTFRQKIEEILRELCPMEAKCCNQWSLMTEAICEAHNAELDRIAERMNGLKTDPDSKVEIYHNSGVVECQAYLKEQVGK